jgi:hypothetical protein
MNTQLILLMLQLAKILKSGDRGGLLPPGKAGAYWICRTYCEVMESQDPELPRLAGYQIDIGACSNYPWAVATSPQGQESEIKTELL